MTWEEFVDAVNEQLLEKQIPRATELEGISWDRSAFGDQVIPDVYVNDQDPKTGRIFIGED